MHILIKNKFLNYGDYKVKCSIGKRGINSFKREGDLTTPRGKFRIKGLFYRKDRIKKFIQNMAQFNHIPKSFFICVATILPDIMAGGSPGPGTVKCPQ